MGDDDINDYDRIADELHQILMSDNVDADTRDRLTRTMDWVQGLASSHRQDGLPKWTVQSAFEQIRACRYECEAGPLESNTAFQWLLRLLQCIPPHATPDILRVIVGPHAFGWICETHPERAWPHDACPGPGMPLAARIGALVHQRDYQPCDCERYDAELEGSAWDRDCPKCGGSGHISRTWRSPRLRSPLLNR